MSLTRKERETLDYYNAHAEEWRAARATGVDTYWMDEIDLFLKELQDGKLLEIGAGSGREARVFIERGIKYTGIDASGSLLEIAQRENPLGNFLVRNVYDLKFPDGSFDGFWSAATLLHLPKNRVTEALKGIRRVVKPDGAGFISLKEGLEESVEEETGRFFAYYTKDEFVGKLGEAGMRLQYFSQKTNPRDNTTWLSFFVRT